MIFASFDILLKYDFNDTLLNNVLIQ